MRTTNKPQNVSDESNIFVKKKKVQKLQNLTVLQDLKDSELLIKSIIDHLSILFGWKIKQNIT